MTRKTPAEGGYLEVQTPAAACKPDLDRIDLLDARSFVHGEWVTPLDDWSCRSRYDWLAWLLPCVAIPQIELRLDVATSTARSVLSHALGQLATLAVVVSIALVGTSRHKLTAREMAGDALWLFVLAAFLALRLYCSARDLAALRTRAREALAIPGSHAADLRAALLRPGGVVRQLGRQLHCDVDPPRLCGGAAPAETGGI